MQLKPYGKSTQVKGQPQHRSQLDSTGQRKAQKLRSVIPRNTSQLSKRTRHIAIRYHYIKDAVNKGELQLQWRKGKDNRADILTKLLPGPALTNERLKWSSGNWASELVERNDVEN
jgi:hypothetical protein